MDDATKQYLDKKLDNIATKDDVGAIASTLSDVVTLIDKRFDGVDRRFDKVEGGLDTIEDKVDSMTNQVSGHEKRLAFLEDKVLQ